VRVACLGSGSKGNAWLVEAGRTRIMVDCGFGPREVERRLTRLGVSASQLDALFITHEHSDHGRGATGVALKARCPVWMSHGSQVMLSASGEFHAHVKVIEDPAPFALGEMEITPYPVPHDAREPMQFTFSDGNAKFGLLTDAGHITPHMESILTDCDVLALECNHDVGLLESGRYPAMLKRRILGPYGHLDNQAAARLLSKLVSPRLRVVIAAHLSQENNTPELARTALSEAWGCEQGDIAVADQDNGLDWLNIG